MDLNTAVATDNIPVEITVRIGRRRLTVAELSALKENDVLPLDQNIDEDVEVCVGDHVIAYGELMEDEDGSDRLMLRITRAAQKDA
ncbi:MAG: FliM/FliN family flagellar motor switch protein [Paracoccus denitrificans]|uniref:FliM/FliN family flagellar motor switch protein n=1 Tax=Paracoccus denitrificans TaxID=266 RepID=A0A533IA51_PARDE|nr:MAG: FliM/FliN family flagellar motor switch protein [Paracoccus denitrificans]